MGFRGIGSTANAEIFAQGWICLKQVSVMRIEYGRTHAPHMYLTAHFKPFVIILGFWRHVRAQ